MSSNENHQRAAELHDLAAHAHRTAAEQRGKQDHLTGQEQSRRALEHSGKAYWWSQGKHEGSGHAHTVIASLAHDHWQKRGSPDGSPETDWFHALTQLD